MELFKLSGKEPYEAFRVGVPQGYSVSTGQSEGASAMFKLDEGFYSLLL